MDSILKNNRLSRWKWSGRYCWKPLSYWCPIQVSLSFFFLFFPPLFSSSLFLLPHSQNTNSVQKNLKYFEERTVQEFLTDFNIASAPIYCEEGASVLDAMKLLVEHKVHRIYVAKKEGKVGVVTFTDIIDTILIGSFTEILSAMPVG